MTLITHRDGTVHFSQLAKFARSAAHYKHACTAENEPTRAMRIGTAVHHRVLGERSDRPMDVFPGDARRGNAWKDFAASHRTSEILTLPEWEESKPIAEAVLCDPVAMTLLRGVETEVPLKWTDNGIPCSTSGIDIIGNGYLGELKTTSNAEPRWFQRHAIKMLYHAQMVWYRNGVLSIGRRIDELFIIAVEDSPPYAVTVLRMTPDIITEGELYIGAWMEQLKICADANVWPGYAQTHVDWELPEWMLEMEE